MWDPAPTKNVALGAYIGLVAFSIAGSALSKFANVDPGPIAPIASAATLIAGLAVLLRQLGPKGAIVPVLIGGAAIELVGLATGRPFGNYDYTGAWVPVVPIPGVGNLPLLLPFAWFMVAGAATFLFSNRVPCYIACFGTALVAATTDLVMEPVMVERLRYWSWSPQGPLPGGATVANFAAWFMVSLLAAIWMNLTVKSRPTVKDSATVLLGHLILMASIWLLG